MPYYRHKTTGKVLWVKEGTKMIDIWELVTEEDYKPPTPPAGTGAKIASAYVAVEETGETPVYDTVEELRSKADKSKKAATKRGAVYEYTDEVWKKTE